ncbi:MAG: DUF5663 domain-containing protein [bacterium]
MSTIKENLFDLFQLDKMPPEKGLEMLDRLAKLVFQAVLVRVLPMLSEEEMTEYERIVDSKEEGGDALFIFLSKVVPEFDKIVAEESEILRMELSGELKEAGI